MRLFVFFHLFTCLCCVLGVCWTLRAVPLCRCVVLCRVVSWRCLGVVLVVVVCRCLFVSEVVVCSCLVKFLDWLQTNCRESICQWCFSLIKKNEVYVIEDDQIPSKS